MDKDILFGIFYHTIFFRIVNNIFYSFDLCLLKMFENFK